jgi:hypothetical protein
MLTLSSHTSPRNPNPAKTPVLTVNDATRPTTLILNGV